MQKSKLIAILASSFLFIGNITGNIMRVDATEGLLYTAEGVINSTAEQEIRAKGIDVSYWQGDINYELVKEDGYDFVMIRAGYGKSKWQVDKNFKKNIEGVQKAGLKAGVYWFSYALTPEEAEKEAQACLEVIQGYKLEYPVVFDFETPAQMKLSSEESCAIVDAFCSKIEEEGYFASVYTYEWLANNNFTLALDYDVWLANVHKKAISYKRQIGMWQYSITGEVKGVNTEVDLNYAYKDYPEIMKRKGLNGYNKNKGE